jgi:hypothetical protein
MCLRVSPERHVLGCLFWTFEFPILNLLRISDFDIRILSRLWMRSEAALGIGAHPHYPWHWRHTKQISSS